MKPQANRLYLTTGEVAAWLRVSPRTVQWLIRTQQLAAALRIADEYLIEESSLAAFIDAHTLPAHPERGGEGSNAR
jgi:excisionase family DNA binding protein